MVPNSIPLILEVHRGSPAALQVRQRAKRLLQLPDVEPHFLAANEPHVAILDRPLGFLGRLKHNAAVFVVRRESADPFERARLDGKASQNGSRELVFRAVRGQIPKPDRAPRNVLRRARGIHAGHGRGLGLAQRGIIFMLGDLSEVHEALADVAAVEQNRALRLKPQIGHNIRFQAPISTRSA